MAMSVKALIETSEKPPTKVPNSDTIKFRDPWC
jgi:hypothetical protein